MIDVIIPVYNTPINDLKRCLDSVLNQTFKDYKVYIIDDGSKDEVKDYLDDYINDKDNFHVTHIKNSGVSYARNLGIELSDSNYICFIDSDDTVDSNYLKEAYQLIEDNNLDVIMGGYREIKENEIVGVKTSISDLIIFENNNKYYVLDKVLRGSTIETNIEIGESPVGRVCTKLFKRLSISNLRFDTNIHMSEDTLFMIDYINEVNRIGITDKVWYNYYNNSYSTTHNKDKEKLINDIRKSLEQVILRMDNEKNVLLKDAYQKRIDRVNKYIERINKK